MAAPDSIKKLVEEFERLKGGPPPDSFDEAQLGTSYLEPFWGALGWAVRDPREVVKEKRVHLRASTKSADYCFQLARKPQFVVEAKDYRKHLDDADFIFQTKRYGYNLPVDFGVLTNFAAFRLFDTGLQPLYENPGRGLFKKFDLPYTEYEERWDELAAVFSREAVAAGALRELLPKARRTRNKEALDRKFFERLNEWRAELARNVAIRNKDLGVHDINEAVQRILDRAIFMRVIEDRGIEATELLLDALNRWKVEKEKDLYRYVVDKFRYLEPQYNGELFYKHFSEDLLVDDKPLRDFIESLYYPRCPYQFNVVGVEMLGTIYERFLGSEIRLTPSHRAVVEPKPEVRKAGGVYYTPRYIVDYIVENTVGELLKKCKTPAAAAKLKILDPACGSGSFLLGAFRRLIDWHEDFFTANPEKIGKGLAAACWRDADEEKYRLTARFKGQILVNNIFGVDIDPQACEVTRMSLYLKVLENVDAQFLMKTALLPPLDANIKCGNSLIGSDYFDVEVGQTLLSVPPDEEERRRVNPFDWEVEFPAIMKAGGFDAVIGNPPYIRIQTLKETNPKQVEYFKTRYRAAASGNYDIYVLFAEKGLSVLTTSGKMGFILPNKFVNAQYGNGLRRLIAAGNNLYKLVDFGDHQVFDGATTYTCLLFLSSVQNKGFSFLDVSSLFISEGEFPASHNEIKTGILNKEYWDFKLGINYGLSEKISDGKPKLGEIASIFVGLQTSADPIYILDLLEDKPDYYIGYSKSLDRDIKLEKGICKCLLKGSDIHRYTSPPLNRILIFPYYFVDGEPRGLNENELESAFPQAYSYLNETKQRLLTRANVNKTAWFLYPYPKNLGDFEEPKILTGVLAKAASFTYDVHGVYYFVGGGNAGGYGVSLNMETDLNPLYVLGILNSPISDYYLKNISTRFRGGYFSYARRYIERLPIHPVNLSDESDVARHDKMVALVEEMLELHKRLAAAKSDADKKRIQRAVDATDRKIDALVYELYGLNDEEIKIVEGA